LTVYSGDATTLTVSSEDASGGLYGDGFFNGAKARVLTRGPDGLVLKKTANVLRYGINRVGVFQPVILPDDSPSKTAVLALTRKDDISLAVGRRGLIVYNSSGQTPEIIESGVEVDLTGSAPMTKDFWPAVPPVISFNRATAGTGPCSQRFPESCLTQLPRNRTAFLSR
jgi:hypothetical protein